MLSCIFGKPTSKKHNNVHNGRNQHKIPGEQLEGRTPSRAVGQARVLKPKHPAGQRPRTPSNAYVSLADALDRVIEAKPCYDQKYQFCRLSRQQSM